MDIKLHLLLHTHFGTIVYPIMSLLLSFSFLTTKLRLLLIFNFTELGGEIDREEI